jgi:E3 ubiquitin-protein ligase HUWE1
MHVFKESFLMSTLVHGVNWHMKVKVIIAGKEKVLDAGGLLREWINLTIKEIMHPESRMFELAEKEDATNKISSDADPVEHVLMYWIVFIW